MTVSIDLRDRLDELIREMKAQITPSAGRSIDRSTICRFAIEELLGRYEESPMNLADRLGFRVPASYGE